LEALAVEGKMNTILSRVQLRWVVCALLFLITAVNYIDRSTLGLLEPVLKHQLGGDQDPALYTRHYSQIVNCFLVAYGLGFLIMGRVIDRIGARLGLALSIAIWALASISHAFARTVPAFGAARFALGLGESGNFPAALKATADWFPPEERALATGIFNSATSAASLIAPLLVPWVAYRFGWQAAFFVTGGLSLTWLACWLLFPYNRLHRARGHAASTIDTPARTSFGSLLTRRATWAFACSKACTDPVWWFYLFWLPKYFHERFLVNLTQLGIPLILVYSGATIGSIVGGWLSVAAVRRGYSLRAGRRFAMFVCALGALAVIAVPFAQSLGEAVGLLCVATAAHQGWSSNLLSTPSDSFPSGSVGTVVGIGGAIGSIGSVAFTSLVGIVWTRSPLLLFLIAGFVYLAAFVVFQIGLGGRGPKQDAVGRNPAYSSTNA
jgi:ACS family hexuronate transporter-like MFS transporter